MKILLIGASGMIGSRILAEAVSRGHQVLATARSPDKIETGDWVTAAALDVNDPEAVAGLAAEADVVISAVSPRSTGDPVAEAKAFAATLIEAQRRAGKRLVMVGGAGSLHMADGSPVLDHLPDEILGEATGMRRAYEAMVAADIDFVVLVPAGTIAPGARTGVFRLGGRTMLTDADGAPSGIIAEDFAVATLDEVERPRHFRTIVSVGY